MIDVSCCLNTATITIANQWTTGYTANLAVESSGPVSSWTVVAVYPDPVPTLGPVWNMMMAQDRSIVVFRPVTWTLAGGGFVAQGTTTAPDTLSCLVI